MLPLGLHLGFGLERSVRGDEPRGGFAPDLRLGFDGKPVGQRPEPVLGLGEASLGVCATPPLGLGLLGRRADARLDPSLDLAFTPLDLRLALADARLELPLEVPSLGGEVSAGILDRRLGLGIEVGSPSAQLGRRLLAQLRSRRHQARFVVSRHPLLGLLHDERGYVGPTCGLSCSGARFISLADRVAEKALQLGRALRGPGRRVDDLLKVVRQRLALMARVLNRLLEPLDGACGRTQLWTSAPVRAGPAFVSYLGHRLRLASIAARGARETRLVPTLLSAVLRPPQPPGGGNLWCMEREQIVRHDFPTSRKGWDPEAVVGHLREVAVHVEELQRPQGHRRSSDVAAERVRTVIAAAEELAVELTAEAEGVAGEAEAVAEAIRDAARREAEATEAAANTTLSSAREEAEETLGTARSEAVVTLDRARVEAQRLLGDARSESDELLESSRAEANRRIEEAEQAVTGLIDHAAELGSRLGRFGEELAQGYGGDASGRLATPSIPASVVTEPDRPGPA